MDPRGERDESTTSGCSSLGLLRSDALSDISGISGYNSSSSSVFMALAREEDEDTPQEGTLEGEDIEDHNATDPKRDEVFSDFEPTPVAFNHQKRHSNLSISNDSRTPLGLPANLLVPSESTPNTPINPCALPASVQRLLQNLVTSANKSVESTGGGGGGGDQSNLSWDKLFGNQEEREPPSFCTGQFSARSTSFGTTNSSSSLATRSSKGDITQNERFSDYSNPPSALMSLPNSVQSHYSMKDGSNPFDMQSSESGCFFDSMKQDQEGLLAKEEFQSLDSQFIDEAEKENKDKYRFMQEQTMSSDVASATSKLGLSQCFNNTNASAGGITEDQLSRSQYFMMNTSRLGNSICNATDDSSRPNLGFGTIRSPELKPRPLLEKSSNMSTTSSSKTNSTFTLSEISRMKKDSLCKKLSLPESEYSMSSSGSTTGNTSNDSKILEEALKNKLASNGELDLNFISMLMNNSCGGGGGGEIELQSDGKKGSAEYLVSMILKTLEASNVAGKKSSMDMSTVSGALPSFLEVSHDSSRISNKSRKKSHGARHSSPIRTQTLSSKLKIQPINSVIKSSKSVNNDPNVSIVVTDGLMKKPELSMQQHQQLNSSSPVQLQVLTREGDKIDFGLLPEDCSTTEDLVLVHNGQHDQEIRLEIQGGQLPSFIYPTDGQTKYIKIISSKNIILTLPAISLATAQESVACSIKISIHTPASGSEEIKTLNSQINILCEGKLLAQVPMVARVGRVKLQTLKDSKIPVLKCSPNGLWFRYAVPMINVGNMQMTLSLEMEEGSSHLGMWKLEESVMILQPSKEYMAQLLFHPTEVGEGESTLKCTVQPNGINYLVKIKIASSRSLEIDNAAKFPVVQLGKLSTSSITSSPIRKNSSSLKPNPSVKPCKDEPMVFPVEADKSFMNWIAVPVGTSDEQILTLKNSLSESIAVTLVVRESALFKVKLNDGDDYKRSIDIGSLPGNGTCSVRVAFQPTSLLKKGGNCVDVGKLIIKPQLGASKSYKATILLQGNAGAPEFTFSGFGDEVNGKQSLFLGQLTDKPIVKTLSIRNKGSGPGFVTFLAIGNDGALSDAIYFESTESIVLYPNESTVIRFSVDSRKVPMGDKNQVFVGFIHVYTGSELGRSAMRKAQSKLQPSAKLKIQSSAFGGGVLANFEGEFKGERESFSGPVGYSEVKSFYKNSRRMIMELSGISSSKDETLLKFNSLPIEETLSESRMDNTNYNSSLFHAQSHSPPTRCSPIVPEEMMSGPAKIFQIHDEEIFIESRKTVLVTLVNLTNETQGFDLAWPAHILMVQPSSGVVRPKQRETLAITAIAQEKRKGIISLSTAQCREAQSICFHVLPLKFTVEPDKIKFAHPGTEMKVSLRNHTEHHLEWEIKDSDPNFKLSVNSSGKEELLPGGSMDFNVLFQPLRSGAHIEKTICFVGRAVGGGSPVMTALLEVSGGQSAGHFPIPMQSLVSPTTEVNKKTVYLDKESISFPLTKVGETSTVKVIVKNRLNTAQTFNVEALSSPFGTKFNESSIVIKPMSYLGFPVSFTPSSRGDFKQNIVLKNSHRILVGILMGSGVF